jgi:hypothetical protein
MAVKLLSARMPHLKLVKLHLDVSLQDLAKDIRDIDLSIFFGTGTSSMQVSVRIDRFFFVETPQCEGHPGYIYLRSYNGTRWLEMGDTVVFRLRQNRVRLQGVPSSYPNAWCGLDWHTLEAGELDLSVIGPGLFLG